MDALAQNTTETRLDICPTGQFRQVCGAATGPDDLVGSVITIIFVVAIILTLAFLIYGGIRWILSGGDKGKVEEARNTIVAAIVGILIIFFSYFALNFVLGLFGLSLQNLRFPQINLTGGGQQEIATTPSPTPTPIVVVATPTPTPEVIIVTPTPNSGGLEIE